MKLKEKKRNNILLFTGLLFLLLGIIMTTYITIGLNSALGVLDLFDSVPGVFSNKKEVYYQYFCLIIILSYSAMLFILYSKKNYLKNKIKMRE